MCLDDRLLCAKEGCTAVLLAVHLVLQVGNAALEQQVSQLAAKVCKEHLLEHTQQHLCHALGQLEDDIAGKAIADHHVHLAVGHITRLDIAHKADARGSLEQLVGVPQHGSALALLGTVVGQCYAGVFAAFYFVHIAAAHDRKSGQHLRAALHVGTAVQQQISLLLCGHHGSQCRALDAPQSAHDEACANVQRTGAAGRDKGIALALLEHIQTHHDGGILLLTDGAGGLVAHLDGLGAVHQFDAVQWNIMLGGGLAHQRLVAHTDQLHAVLLDGLCSAFQNSQRGVVAAHHVHNDLHTCFLLSGGLPYRAVSSSQCWKLATARSACAM